MASRVVLYSKPGCHLCDDARGLLDGWGIAYDMIESDPRYELRVPVVEVDGRVDWSQLKLIRDNSAPR